MLSYQPTRILVYPYIGMPAYNYIGIQVYQDIAIPVYRCTGILVVQYTCRFYPAKKCKSVVSIQIKLVFDLRYTFFSISMNRA